MKHEDAECRAKYIDLPPCYHSWFKCDLSDPKKYEEWKEAQNRFAVPIVLTVLFCAVLLFFATLGGYI